MYKILRKLKLNTGNHIYRIARLTTGKYYITREFSHKGFELWKQGKLKNRSGILF